MRIETEITDWELVKESPYTLPSFKIQNKVWREMKDLLCGGGTIESYQGMGSCKTIVVGKREDLPWLVVERLRNE